MRESVARLALVVLVACGTPETSWHVVGRHLPAALLSVWGRSASDVYLVGGDLGDGRGPAVLHWDGAAWTRLDTGQVGNLWWVFGFADGPVYLGGDGGMILRYQAGRFTRMPTPGSDTVFGIWGAAPDDVWAVGGAAGGGSGAFAWRLVADSWVAAPGFPAELAEGHAIWKIHGRGASDAWMVGTGGNAVRWDGAALRAERTGAGESLFTVQGDARGFVAVGGFGTGKILENPGDGWRDVSPPGAPGLVGVWLSARGDYAVGQEGAIYARNGSRWDAVNTGVDLYESFHSVWIDPQGGVWSVGGQVLTLPLVDGIVLYQGVDAPRGL